MHSGGIGRKEGSAESAAVDNYLALFEMVNGAIADIRLGYLVHGNSGHYASGNTDDAQAHLIWQAHLSW